MANNGPFGKGIENDKGNIFESEMWKKNQRMYNGAFLKSLSIFFVPKGPDYIEVGFKMPNIMKFRLSLAILGKRF